MKEWLIVASENAIVIIDAFALAIILFGTAEAFANGLKLIFSSPTSYEKRSAWLRYACWLVAALTFQLAADIIGHRSPRAGTPSAALPRLPSSAPSSTISWSAIWKRSGGSRKRTGESRSPPSSAAGRWPLPAKHNKVTASGAAYFGRAGPRLAIVKPSTGEGMP